MATSSIDNRAMFWRIVRRLLLARPGRLFVILLALMAGAAVTAALLNLQIDAQRRLTSEFRAFGPNVIVSPKESNADSSRTLDENVVHSIPTLLGSAQVVIVPRLFTIANVSSSGATASVPIVVASEGGGAARFSESGSPAEERSCIAGSRVAQRLKFEAGERLNLHSGDRDTACKIDHIASTGGSADDQIGVSLTAAQALAGLPGRLTLIELNVPGTSGEIQQYVDDLQRRLPDAEIRPLRQFSEAQGKIYNRISGLLSSTIALVLILTSLCVMAAMTNVAMERRMDVGLMKAIGGATRRVVRFFLAEAAVLGLAGGLLGTTIGIVLSIWLGKAVFGIAARPRLVVYPVAVALTVIVAIAAAYPLRRLAAIRPASVFRGEG